MWYNFGTNLLIVICSMIDSFIYGLISIILQGLYAISGTTVGDGLIDDVRQRIYVILAIFMLFKLAISMINGIIDPDKFNDKQSGTSKIIIRVVIVMSLLLMVPKIFEAAITVQGHVLTALPQIILGKINDNSLDSASEGEQIASSVLQAFVNKNEACEDDVATISVSNLAAYASTKCSHNDANGHKIFQYDYMFLISTILGIIMIIFLVLICVDVAIRVFKLSILQIIAPIPIMTYIDPKSSKDGAFNTWVKECISTYISLFIQLGIIYIILYLITFIADSLLSGQTTDIINIPGSDTVQIWVGIFLIVGGFFFMRQAPKFVMKVLGIKDGTGLGIGFGAGLAGMGAILGGGGLLGAGAAVMSGLDAGATANADGKSALGVSGFNKGREIAANFNGLEKPVSTTQRLTDAMQRRRAARFGVTDDSLDQMKKARNNAQTRLSMAESALHEAEQNGSDVQWGNESYSIADFRNMVYGANGFKTDAETLASRYDAMNSFGKSMKVGKSIETYQQKYRSKPGDYNVNPAAYRHPEQTPVLNETQQSLDSETPIQQRINQAANVHDAPTREEHQRLSAEYNEFWNSDSVARAVEAENRRIDERNGN